MPNRLARKKHVRRNPVHESSANGHRRTRQDHALELAEDYVELIDDLIQKCGEARAVDIARHLGVTHVTVTKSISRLRKEGLVTSAPYRSIFLTDKGRLMARRARERHRLVLEFLLSLGVARPDAEADAEGIEHHISPRTLEAMRRFLKEAPVAGE
ncbi:MAG: transcriptional regulator MntR [Planctomycetota bacterium]|nr:MAG: transcriptional regulator MntR [Planctomycetota bacterium]